MKKTKDSRSEVMKRRVSTRLLAKAQMDSPTPASSKRLRVTENVNTPELRKSGNVFIHLSESDQSSSSYTSAEPFNSNAAELSSAEADSHTASAYAKGRKESDQDALAIVTAEDIGGDVTTIASNTNSGRQVTLEEARVIPDVVKEIPKDINNSKTNDEPRTQTSSIDLSGMANMFSDDVSNQDELPSVLFHPALVSVHGYRVKEISAPIVRTIIEKHGDIAMNCIVKTVESRSFFLEKICEIMQTLKAVKFEHITDIEVKNMLALVGDLRRVNMDVGWLEERLEEILEGIELIKQSSKFKERRKGNAQIIKEAKKTLKSLEARILVHETQIRALQEKANSEKEKMKAAEAENESVAQRVSNLKHKVKRFIEESLLHDLQ